MPLSMHWLRRAFQQRQPFRRTTARRNFQTTVKMSSASTAVALYASTVSASQILGAVPEDSKELAHHAKGGKGFINPWESFGQDRPGWVIGKAMIMYLQS
jgi:hypothetical protein